MLCLKVFLASFTSNCRRLVKDMLITVSGEFRGYVSSQPLKVLYV